MNNLCTCFVVSKSHWTRYNLLTLLLHIINQDLFILITILMFKPKYINSQLERTIYQTPSSHLKRSSKSKGEFTLTKPKCSRRLQKYGQRTRLETKMQQKTRKTPKNHRRSNFGIQKSPIFNAKMKSPKNEPRNLEIQTLVRIKQKYFSKKGFSND